MNKEFLKTFFSAGALFGIIMGLFFGMINGIFAGICLGVISGFSFGLVISAFVQIQSRKFKKIGAEVTHGKKIVLDGGANHFKGAEGVGGWLYLTSEEVIFKSHAFNIQSHETVIPLDKIAEIKIGSTLGFIPNRLQLVLKNGVIERFVVFNRNTWVEQLNSAISSL